MRFSEQEQHCLLGCGWVHSFLHQLSLRTLLGTVLSCQDPLERSNSLGWCLWQFSDILCAVFSVARLQVIRLLHNAFKAAGLGLYLRPYGCLPTGYECGIIEASWDCRHRRACFPLALLLD